MDQEESENERNGDGIMGGGETYLQSDTVQRQEAEGAAPLLDLFSGAAAQAAGDQFPWRRRDPRSRSGRENWKEKKKRKDCGLVALYVDSSGGLGYLHIRNVSRSIPHVSDLFY
jgi:hypothetical protein